MFETISLIATSTVWWILTAMCLNNLVQLFKKFIVGFQTNKVLQWNVKFAQHEYLALIDFMIIAIALPPQKVHGVIGGFVFERNQLI